MSQMYYLSTAPNSVEGPFDIATVQQKLAAGMIDGTTPACPQGSQTWQPLASFPELVGPAGGSPAPPGGYRAQAAGIPTMSLVGPILVTLFCCIAGGVVSIVYAALANGAASSGDYEVAARHKKTASTWMWVSFGIGAALTVFWVLMVIVGGVSAFP